MIEAFNTTGEFFGSIDEVCEYIESQGYYINDMNDEYISFADDEYDTEYFAKLTIAGITVIISQVEEA